MRSLVTLSRKDPLFSSYIDGSFSKTERAIPVRSLNVNSDLEQVTFEIRSIDEIEHPGFIKYWAQVFKLRNFMMLAFPAILIINKNDIEDTLLDWPNLIYSLIGALFLMTAANLRNDWSDYVNGVDRIHPHGESHVLLKGWTTARQVHRWSFIYLGFGILFGLPAIIEYPEILILVGALAIVAILGLSTYKAGLKYRRWSEFAVFLMLGPFFTVGLQISMGAPWDIEAIFIGVITGWMSAFYLHIKNFQEMMVNEQANFVNTLSWLGFEKGKRFIFAWWLILSFILLMYQVFYTNLFWQIFFLAIGVLSSAALYKSLKGIPSPLSSRVKDVVRLGKLNLILMTSFILIEAAYFSWILNEQ